ncbi:MAG: GNAT family N-acetyltransferase [Micrococcales bacterium]|nr:GNAT family N-acetyltransferase [Micrococcales bacterium]
MSLPEGYRIVVVPQSRAPEFHDIDSLVWASVPSPEVLAQAPPAFDWGERTVAIEHDDEMVAMHASFAFVAPVPGGTVPCSGLTAVGVRPDHRRRGLLTAMIATHFERSLARGEAISALYAAEEAIYGRYGYGRAADQLTLSVPRGAKLRPVAGSDELTVRFATVVPEVHRDLVDALHRAAGAGRPGWITRDSAQERANHVADPPPWREGGEALRIATVHAPDGSPRGYALLRRKEKWAHNGPEYSVTVKEIAALDAPAAYRLWSFLLDLDLTASVTATRLAVDDPVTQLLVEPRAATPEISDNLWVRLLDLPAALTARRYAAPLDVVLDVTDGRLPANAGRWRLVTASGTPALGEGWAANAMRTDAPADLTLDVRELSAAYLGGRSFVGQATAGLVTEQRCGAAAAAATAFGWPLAPVCSWGF